MEIFDLSNLYIIFEYLFFTSQTLFKFFSISHTHQLYYPDSSSYSSINSPFDLLQFNFISIFLQFHSFCADLVGKTMGEFGMQTTPFHVLAVDDSIIDRKLIERLLKTSSYHVTVVESGVKAIEYLGLLDDENTNTNSNSVSTIKNHNEVEVNLIITDYSMPGITGYDLLKKIKESRLLKDIPVVIMSSENIPSRINSCLEQGAEEFFLKPVKQSDVNKLRPHMMRGKENQPNIINKRKPVEECLSPDSTTTKIQE